MLFHAHSVKTSEGYYVITEFLPEVFWSGPHNTISCPAGHHIMEGRWVRPTSRLEDADDVGGDDTSTAAGDGGVIVDDYSRFWFKQPRVRKGDDDKKVWEKMYTFWAASSIHERWRVTGDTPHIAHLYPELLKNYHSWVATHFSPRYQCMFQASHADGEENSAGLDGCRPTINAMMVAEARSLAAMGSAAGAPPQVGPGRYCSPRHEHALEPSFSELNGILCRGERYLSGPSNHILPATSSNEF